MDIKFICKDGYLVLQRHLDCIPDVGDSIVVWNDFYIVDDRKFVFRAREEDDEVMIYLRKK